ncbi:unnamed protein product [Laminaria digitata]
MAIFTQAPAVLLIILRVALAECVHRQWMMLRFAAERSIAALCFLFVGGKMKRVILPKILQHLSSSAAAAIKNTAVNAAVSHPHSQGCTRYTFSVGSVPSYKYYNFSLTATRF